MSNLWTIVVALILGVAGAGVLLARARRGATPAARLAPRTSRTPLAPREVSANLRLGILKSKPEAFGIVVPDTPAGVWGTVTDSPLLKNMVTVVAMADGSASIYYSTGGGIIGGGDRTSA